MKYPVGIGLCGCVLLASCGGRSANAVDIAPPSLANPAPPPGLPPFVRPIATDWHHAATLRDRDRLRRWRDAWLAALAKVHAAGADAEVAKRGALFEFDHALPVPTPPPGRYRCQTFKLGANGVAMRDFTAYPAYECHVTDEGGVSRIYQIGGTQRPMGTLFPDGAARQVFLGTVMFGDETAGIAYGRDTARDMAGYVERIGEKRWRLVLPYPMYESLLDVIELVPADGPITP